MKKTMLGLFVWFALAGICVAQDHGKDGLAAPAPAYEPTELESWKLKAEFKDLQLQQMIVNQANADLQQKIATLNADIAAMKKAHNWPENLQLNTKDFKFAVPPAPAPAPAPVPDKPTPKPPAPKKP